MFIIVFGLLLTAVGLRLAGDYEEAQQEAGEDTRAYQIHNNH